MNFSVVHFVLGGGRGEGGGGRSTGDRKTNSHQLKTIHQRAVKENIFSGMLWQGSHYFLT